MVALAVLASAFAAAAWRAPPPAGAAGRVPRFVRLFLLPPPPLPSCAVTAALHTQAAVVVAVVVMAVYRASRAGSCWLWRRCCPLSFLRCGKPVLAWGGGWGEADSS